MKRYLFLFATTHDALVAEKNWPGSGHTSKLRPIPRVLSSSCGLCLETQLPPGSDLVVLAAEHGVHWEQIVEAKENQYVLVHSKP